jgi:hypothetical protein
MKTYNTYQEAKIAMTKACIIEDTDSGLFFGMPTREGTTLAGGSRFAEPQYYCMAVEKFLAGGHKVVEGDLILDEGVIWTVSDKVNSDTYIYTVKSSNKPEADDNERYILRAAALENQMNIDTLATQTPEEKEALDLIDTTPHQYEMSKFSVVAAKYTDVDGEIFEQVDFDKTILTIDGDICIESDLYFAWSNKNIVPVSDVTGRDLLMNRHKLCKRIETPQQREERERSEWIEKFAHKVKHVSTMTYKDILGEMYDSLKGESK